MVKSSRSELHQMRDAVFRRDGHTCIWLGCTTGEPLQMAHLVHRGMGGSRERNHPDNAVTLCATHHDVFDGRTALGTGRRELADLLRRLAGIR